MKNRLILQQYRNEEIMPSIALTRLIEKMKLENLTPEIEVKGIRLTQPDLNRPALQLTEIGRAHV